MTIRRKKMKGEKNELLKAIIVEFIFIIIVVFITKEILDFIIDDTLEVFILFIFCIIINIFHEPKIYLSIKTFLRKKIFKK